MLRRSAPRNDARSHFAATLFLLLAGCTVGPNYRAPQPPPPPAYAEAKDVPADGRPVDLARWWQAFADPELTKLIETALAQNLDVKAAISRVRNARLGIVQVRAAGLPEIDLAGNAQRQYLHETVKPDAGLTNLVGGILPGAEVPDSAPIHGHSDSYSGSADASWQVDVFGGVRRSVEAARARTDAAEWNVRDAQVTLAAEIASAYLQYRSLQAQEVVTRYELARQSRSLETQSHIFKAGLVPESNSIQQRAQLAATQATLAPLQANQRVQAHAIAVLLAQEPETLLDELKPIRLDPPPPPAVTGGLPSELLRRRPDVRAAERQLAASTADIGVAVADLYPSFNLTGAFTLMSQSFGGLLTISGRTASGAGAINFPLLDFGRRRSIVGQRREAAEQSYLQYQATVLGAVRDVEDALATLGGEMRRNQALREGVQDSNRSLAAVRARFDRGLTDYLDVLSAQQTVLSAQTSLAVSDGALRQDLATLYRALGGGWDETQPIPDAAPLGRANWDDMSKVKP